MYTTAILTKPITISPLFQYSLQPIQNWITAKNELPQSIELWATYFQSHSDTASIKHHRTNPATLIFGSPTFQIADFIPNGSANTPLLFLENTPRCTVKRNGAIFELRARKQCSEKTYFFIKAKITYCQNKVTVKTFGNELSPETATSADLFQFDEDGFAFRFDALSNLPLTNTGIGRQFPFVTFFDTTFAQPGISMRGLLVTDAPLANTPIIVEKTTPTQAPMISSLQQQVAQGLPPLHPNEPLEQNTLRRFASFVDYTSVQERSDFNSLWILPTKIGEQLAPHAEKIRDAVQNLLLDETPNSTRNILASVGIDLEPKKNRGFGGILLEPGVEIHISPHYVQNVYGIIILPAEHTVSGGDLFKIPLGNNGHGAVGFGTTMITPFSDPLILSFDCGYFYTIPKTEKIALPLKKSMLSVGPVVDATVSWHTVYINPSISVTHHRKSIDALFGVDYVVYYTSKDHITTSHLFSEQKPQFAIARKAKRSKQLIQTVNITACLTHNTPHYAFNALFTITRTVHAHNALFEKGWSITCGVTF